MKAHQIKNKLREILSDSNKRRIAIAVIGITGILLILLSELIPDKNKTSTEEYTPSEDTYSSEYKQALERELCDILKSINGVGEVSVMVTLDGTTEYVYAEELDTVDDSTDTSKRQSYKSKLVITDSGGEKKALVKKIIRPQVTGVIVVCSGGDDIHIKEQLISAVSAVLGIPAGRVCIMKLK